MSASPRLELFPRPRRVEVHESTAAPRTEPTVVVDSSLPAQGYVIDAGPAGTQIRHADEAGLRYARQTLAQLDETGRPRVHIEDWPDFATRGFMLDISRDRVPTRATLERLVDLLADLRYNHLELYTEHTFEHPGHDIVWASASPITADDLRWLDQRCRTVGIELVANQNCFGHMERWLRHEAYRDRAEAPEGFEVVPGVVLPPAVLEPTEENAAFGVELVRNQTSHVASRTVNVGCDETFELGRGKSREAVRVRGKEAVYVEHVARLVGPLLDEGHRVLFWGDVLESDPSWLASLPDGDLVPVVWTYERPLGADEAPRVPESIRSIMSGLGIDPDLVSAGFGPRLSSFADLGRDVWVAPGTSSWNSLVGRIDNARANLLDAATAGLEVGATGYLVTDWGDNGHLQPCSVSFGPMLYGAAVSWCADTNAGVDVANALDVRVFGDEAGILGGVLDSLGRQWSRTGQVVLNASPLQAALCVAQFQFVLGEPDAERVASVVDAIDAAVDALGHARPTCVDAEIVVRELALAARMARHGAVRLLARAGRATASDQELRVELLELIDEYRAAWLERSRPGGLDDSVAHLEATLASYG
jgi:hypothetical protein